MVVVGWMDGWRSEDARGLLVKVHAELKTTCVGCRDGRCSKPIDLEIHFDQSEARTGSGLADRSRPNRGKNDGGRTKGAEDEGDGER